jgi:hypothetical protein
MRIAFVSSKIQIQFIFKSFRRVVILFSHDEKRKSKLSIFLKREGGKNRSKEGYGQGHTPEIQGHTSQIEGHLASYLLYSQRANDINLKKVAEFTKLIKRIRYLQE